MAYGLVSWARKNCWLEMKKESHACMGDNQADCEIVLREGKKLLPTKIMLDVPHN